MEIVLIVVVAAMLIFFMFNNRKKQKARQEQLSNDLVPGASVMTSFGLFGTVVSVDNDENKVTIECGPGTTLVVHKQAIGQIQAPTTAEPVESAEPAADNEDVEAAAAVVDETPADGKPRITDAELDAMNEAKKAKTDAAEAAPGKDATADDATAESADADVDSASKSESDK